ncbi:MAG: hypothetical protein GKR98_12220 [Boseongicola sp.]|nr:MAG: hypothetical protein GKR98_12220 [Boseongicola sp.]
MTFFALGGCGGLAWNATLANHPQVRADMLDSVKPGVTTEITHTSRWGNPTQKIREGAQTRFIYRDMSNPPEYRFPQFGDSSRYVVVIFQYGIAVSAYSSDNEGCRGTFAPRPPGAGFENPTTIHPVNCGRLDANQSTNTAAPNPFFGITEADSISLTADDFPSDTLGGKL